MTSPSTNRLWVVACVLIGIAFGAGAMWLGGRIAPGDLAAADRIRVERVVHDYVLANPEIIPEAMRRLQAKETGTAIAQSRGAIETPYGDAWIGNADGDVTLVEYFDYNCGYCRATLPVIQQLVAQDPNLRVVFRELPILADTSRTAAAASLQAAAQGKFKPFHAALYAAGPVSPASIAAVAAKTGVDLSRTADGADEELRTNLASAGRLGVTGTPAWVVGDAVLTGALPLDQLKEAVAKARASR